MSAKQAEPQRFDLVVLGSGEGSKYLAWSLAGQGQHVAVVEREYIGGSCPNIACLPSKNVIHSAKAASYHARAHEFGIASDGYHVDMSGVRERKRTMVDGLVAMNLANFEKSGAELVMGTGRFIAPLTVEVALRDGATRALHGKNVVIGTGTRATIDPIPGLVDARPLTHIDALELREVPGHLVILGGGYIGLELAQAARRFGSRVTVIDRNQRLLPREDGDVAQGLTDLLQEGDIDIVLGAQPVHVSGVSGEAVEIVINQGKTIRSLKGTHLLVATGRTPNTNGLGLDLAGVELTPRGYIRVNERLESSAPGVWAIGEAAGSPQFTHIAFDDFRVIRDNLLGGHRMTTGRLVPYCLFTDPELARVGVNEIEAASRHVGYRLFKIPANAVLRTRTLSETRGFWKALVSVDSDRILGFTAFGVGAGEVMSTVQIAMIAGLPFTGIRDAILTHPTLCEGLVALFSSSPSVHSVQSFTAVHAGGPDTTQSCTHVCVCGEFDKPEAMQSWPFEQGRPVAHVTVQTRSQVQPEDSTGCPHKFNLTLGAIHPT